MPTKQALDAGDFAPFSSIFLASSFFCSQAFSTPAPAPVTQTVRQILHSEQRRETEMYSELRNQSLLSGFGIKLSLIAWLAMLGFDFFLHAGVLAGIYTRESPFLLPPLDAFRRIPIGYLSFLVVAFFLVWLSLRLNISDVREGLLLGLGLGLVMWASLGLGLYSITTAEPITLISWAIGQSLEMAIAGGLVGLALQKGDLRRSFQIALISAVLLVIVTILLQSFGVVQSTQL